MSSGELSFEFSPCLRVTWTIPDFFQLAIESGLTVRSPYFTFANDRHCLKLFQMWDTEFDYIRIELLNSNDLDPGRAVSYEVELKSGSVEIDFYREVGKVVKLFLLDRTDLKDNRDVYVPGGTLTVLCSMRSRQKGWVGSPESSGAQIPGYRMTGHLSSESFPFLCVTWSIPASFEPTRNSRLQSPEFPFSDRVYRLRLVPNKSFVDIHLVNLTDPVPGSYVSYEVGFKLTTGEEIEVKSFGKPTERKFVIRRRDMQSLRFPDGHFTLVCWMHSREPSSNKEALTGGVANLLSDYKQLLLNGADSDACLVVCGKEFQAHRNVLRARSPVFGAMFDHVMAEKASGRVVIDDLKPDCFQDFLKYLYTGCIESFCDDNAFGLYAAADKYDVPSLKSECVEYMRRSLSVDNFCDVITLALRHHEQDLLEHVVEFFKMNVAGIILTVKWQQFMSENSTRANELFIKLHVPGRELDNVLLP